VRLIVLYMLNRKASAFILDVSILIAGLSILPSLQDQRSSLVMELCKDSWAVKQLSHWLHNGSKPTNYSYVFLFLVAIIAANLSASYFGPVASIANAFFFIGFNITCRDKLHDSWHNNNLILKMALLILTGSVISYCINASAGRIAIASFIAFALASVADTIVYGILFKRARIVKINTSNMASSLVDSVAFSTIAFGSFMPLIVAGQFVTKMFGGFLWSLILTRRQNHSPNSSAP
jgi:queuosine precursor transporter